MNDFLVDPLCIENLLSRDENKSTIYLDDGRILHVPYSYIVNILSPEGGLVEVQVDKLQTGNYIPTPLAVSSYNTVPLDWQFDYNQKTICYIKIPNIPSILSSKLSELLGILIGDGNVSSQMGTFSISIGKRDTDYVKYVCDLLYELFNLPSKIIVDKNNNIQVVLHSVIIRSFIEYLGLRKGDTYKNKIVPQCIFLSDTECRRSFIRGLFDTDGSIGIGSSSDFSFSCFNIQLARQVQLLLYSVGIVNTLSKGPANNWQILLHHTSCKLVYCNLISSSLNFKKERLIKYEEQVKKAKRPGYRLRLPEPLYKKAFKLIQIYRGKLKRIDFYSWNIGVSAERFLHYYAPHLQSVGADVEELCELSQLFYNKIIDIKE